jgi:hypothetical protein
MKQFVRKHSEQNFSRILSLVVEARKNFEERNVNIKLQRRFWECLHSYGEGKEYKEVLCLFFSSVSKSEIHYHRKVTNAKIDDK